MMWLYYLITRINDLFSNGSFARQGNVWNRNLKNIKLKCVDFNILEPLYTVDIIMALTAQQFDYYHIYSINLDRK